MRGKVAKQLRKLAGGNKQLYKFLKRARDQSSQIPKLEQNPRWLRSPLHRAKMCKDGIHLTKDRPLRSIGDFFIDLTKDGKKRALQIAHNACAMTKFQLRETVTKFKEDKRNYEQKPNPFSSATRSESEELS